MGSILPGLGYDNIRFGISRQQLKQLLGEPDEVEEDVDVDEDLDEASEAWHYDELELSGSFDQWDDWRLGSLAVSAEDAELSGHRVIGLGRNELLELLHSLGFEDLLSEDWSTDDDPGRVLVCSNQHAMNFWFDNGTVTEVQWGPRMLDEETVAWPE